MGVGVWLALIASEASAQSRLRPVGLDPGAGFFAAELADRTELENGVMLNALLAWRVDSLSSGALLTALSASVQASFPNYDCVALPGGDCGSELHDAQALSALFGWTSQRAPDQAAFRAMLGPAVVRLDDVSTGGLHTRFDLSSRAFGRA
jgi:hypothetical protein